MHLLQLIQLVLTNLVSTKTLSGEHETNSRDVKDTNIFSVVIANRNSNSINAASRLFRVSNTMVDMSKLVAATFQPAAEGEVERLKLIFTGGSELVLQGVEAAQVWQGLLSKTSSKS